MYPTQVGCFVAATSLDELDAKENKVRVELKELFYDVLDERYDLERLDKFLRFLPGNYLPNWDAEYNTAKLTSVRHLARLMPFGYGRQSGSKKPLNITFNRNGEIIFENPYADKVNNRHRCALGTTGAGKSVKMGSDMLALMAMIRPYLVLIDAG